VKPLDSLIDESMVTRRSTAVLAGTFAGVALLLTIIGTYGVLSFAVGQRRREIGLRMAIGAAPQQVLAHFLGLGVKLLLGGIVLGGLGVWMTSQAMERLLFGIRGVPLGVLGATVGVMVTVVLTATFVPSYRGARSKAAHAAVPTKGPKLRCIRSTPMGSACVQGNPFFPGVLSETKKDSLSR
jgi:ABC-type antimicrobial peptide transport system permease subunit